MQWVRQEIPEDEKQMCLQKMQWLFLRLVAMNYVNVNILFIIIVNRVVTKDGQALS